MMLDAPGTVGLYLSYDFGRRSRKNADPGRASKLGCHGLLCTSSAHAGAFAGHSPPRARGRLRPKQPAERGHPDGARCD
jgi:hypothetical protein